MDIFVLIVLKASLKVKLMEKNKSVLICCLLLPILLLLGCNTIVRNDTKYWENTAPVLLSDLDFNVSTDQYYVLTNNMNDIITVKSVLFDDIEMLSLARTIIPKERVMVSLYDKIDCNGKKEHNYKVSIRYTIDNQDKVDKGHSILIKCD
jgi:hypothetical protein